jgi:hypothetical protein
MDNDRFEIEQKELNKKIIFNFQNNINESLEENKVQDVFNYVMALNNYILNIKYLEKIKLVIKHE